MWPRRLRPRPSFTVGCAAVRVRAHADTRRDGTVLSAGEILEVLAARPKAPVLWATLDGRLDGTCNLPTDRGELVKIVRHAPPDQIPVVSRRGGLAVHIRSWLETPKGTCLYLDVGE